MIRPMIRLASPEYWRDKADECFAKSQAMLDPDARRTLLQIATMYDAMALRVEQRLAEGQMPAPGLSAMMRS